MIEGQVKIVILDKMMVSQQKESFCENYFTYSGLKPEITAKILCSRHYHRYTCIFKRSRVKILRRSLQLFRRDFPHRL